MKRNKTIKMLAVSLGVMSILGLTPQGTRLLIDTGIIQEAKAAVTSGSWTSRVEDVSKVNYGNVESAVETTAYPYVKSGFVGDILALSKVAGLPGYKVYTYGYKDDLTYNYKDRSGSYYTSTRKLDMTERRKTLKAIGVSSTSDDVSTYAYIDYVTSKGAIQTTVSNSSYYYWASKASAAALDDGTLYALASSNTNNSKNHLYRVDNGTAVLLGDIGSYTEFRELYDITNDSDGNFYIATEALNLKITDGLVRQWAVARQDLSKVFYSEVIDDNYIVYSYDGVSNIRTVKYNTETGDVVSTKNLDLGTTDLMIDSFYGDDGFILHSSDGIYTITKDMNLTKTYSTFGSDVQVLSISKDGKKALVNTTEVTDSLGDAGSKIINIDLDSLTFSQVFPKFSITYTYTKENGTVGTNTYVNYARPTNTSLKAPTVPNLDSGYTVFDKWTPDMNSVVTSTTTFTATYKESSNSFWVGNNRYGIISSSEKTAYFLGSKDSTVKVPNTVENDGVTYTVTKMLTGSLTREGNIKNLTVDSSQLATYSLFAGVTTLNSVEITGSVDIGEYVFKGCTGLTTVDISQYTGNIPNYAFNSCTSLTEVNGKIDGSVATTAFAKTGVKVIQGEQSNVANTTLTDLPYKVYLYNPDESEVIASFWVKNGTSFKSYADKYGTGWTKISGSPIGNITASSEYKCDSLVDISKLANPVLTPSNTNPINRESNINITIS